jgi:opacity protein-like surface antigen
MKRATPLLLLVLLLSQTALASGISLGVGVVGGLDFPVGQDDQKQGSIFGFRGLVKVIPAIAVEPNLYFTKYGDPEFEDFSDGIEGSKITAYGIDARLGAPVGGVGVKPYGVFGAGFYGVKTKTADDITIYDETDFGWSAGFGVEFGVTAPVGLDVRGKLVVIPTEGGGSKKSASVTGGVNYYFGK